jgi:hypothetical protein
MEHRPGGLCAPPSAMTHTHGSSAEIAAWRPATGYTSDNGRSALFRSITLRLRQLAFGAQKLPFNHLSRQTEEHFLLTSDGEVRREKAITKTAHLLATNSSRYLTNYVLTLEHALAITHLGIFAWQTENLFVLTRHIQPIKRNRILK